MLNTIGDLMNEVLVRNNATTADSFVTDAMLQDWVQQAHKWASGYKKWPFTEGRDQTVAFSGEETAYSSFSLKFKSDSIRFVQVGGYRLKKLNFQEYQIMKEETPESDERVYSDFNRTLFINPNLDVSGTIVAYGQYEPLLDTTDLAAKTVFSDYDEDGNEAIVEKMTAYFQRRDNAEDKAELHDQKANVKLEEMWKKIVAEQHAYQSHPASGGMWERVDVINGDMIGESNKRDQF